MSKKTIYILLGVFVVLIAIFLLQKALTRPAGKSESLAALKINFPVDQVSYIQVFKQDYPDSGLFFARKDTTWIVASQYGAPAKNDDVKKIIGDLDSLSGSVRGEDASLYPDFAITDRDALQIKLFGADSSLLAHVYVGKGGSDGHSCFMRLPGSPTVYLANNNFISRFAAWNAPPEKKLPTDRWMELSLCNLKRENMISIKMHTPKTDYEFAATTQPAEDTLSKPKKVWNQVAPSKGKKLDEPKMLGIASSLAYFKANDVADPSYSHQFGLDKPPYSLWAGDSSGQTVLVNFSDKVNDAEDRYVSVAGKPLLYKINKASFERFFVSPFEEPKKPEQPKASKETAKMEKVAKKK